MRDGAKPGERANRLFSAAAMQVVNYLVGVERGLATKVFNPPAED